MISDRSMSVSNSSDEGGKPPKEGRPPGIQISDHHVGPCNQSSLADVVAESPNETSVVFGLKKSNSLKEAITPSSSAPRSRLMSVQHNSVDVLKYLQ